MKLYRTLGTSPGPGAAEVKLDCFCGGRISVLSVPWDPFQWGNIMTGTSGDNSRPDTGTWEMHLFLENIIRNVNHISHTRLVSLTVQFCSLSIVSTLCDIEWRDVQLSVWYSVSRIVLATRVYVNLDQIVPIPQLRVNPTILWLLNIVISLVSIIYISSVS